MAAALSAVLIDFQFYLAAAKSQGSGSELVSFFARIYLLLNIGSMFLQLLVAPRIQKRLGLAGALLVLPVVLLGGAAYGVLSSALAVRAGLRVAEGGLKSGLHRTLWEQTFLQFPSSVRSSAKVLIDGLGARLAEGLAGLALYIWLLVVVKSDPITEHSTLWVTFFLGFSTLVWLSITILLRQRVRQVEFQGSAVMSAAPPPDF
jgi:ATP/ADP translocase